MDAFLHFLIKLQQQKVSAMQPDKPAKYVNYFDPAIRKTICAQYENTGYCKDLSTCKNYHRKQVFKNIAEEHLFSFHPPKQLIPPSRPPVKKTINKPAACHNCKRNKQQQCLFCNSFCGHHFCYDCVHCSIGCNQCSVPIDKQTSQAFFAMYCHRCQTQNAKKLGERVCKKCKFEQDIDDMKLRKQKQIAQKIEKDGSMLCIICMHKKKEFVVFPCAHMLYCETCIQHVEKSKICFFCNSKISGTCKLFY